MVKETKKMNKDQGAGGAAAAAALIDRISALPDHILSLILSRLAVDESARTSALSKRWSRLWLRSPIQISDLSLLKMYPISSEGREARAYFLIRTYTRILSLHPGPIPTCHFTNFCWKDHHKTLARLLETLTVKGVQELVIGKIGSHSYFDRFTIPDCVLRCESLLDLELGYVTLPYHLPKRIFPNLRRLKICWTDVRYHALSDLLKSGSSIAELELRYCLDGFRDTVIKSGSLKRLIVHGAGEDIRNKLIIKDVPSLKCLLMTGDFTRCCKVEIVNAPELETLSHVDMNFAMLRWGTTEFSRKFRHIKYRRLSTRIDSVQTLGIKVNFDYVYQGKAIPYFLRCFPCLEVLDVLIDEVDGGDTDDDYDPSVPPNYGWFWKQREFDIDCFKHSLEEVELRGYSGQHTHLDFAKFVISHARVLKVMTVFYKPEKVKGWEDAQRKCLCLENKASPNARVVFVKGQHFY